MKRAIKYEWSYLIRSKQRIITILLIFVYGIGFPFVYQVFEQQDLNYLKLILEEETSYYTQTVQRLSVFGESKETEIKLYNEYLKATLRLKRSLKLTDLKEQAVSYQQYLKYQVIFFENQMEIFDQFSDYDTIKSKYDISSMNIEKGYYQGISEYHLNSANYFYKFFSGYSLLGICIITILMNYEMLGREFGNGTFKLLYTTNIKRENIALSKLIFCIVQSFVLIFVSSILGYVISIGNMYAGSFNELVLMSNISNYQSILDRVVSVATLTSSSIIHFSMLILMFIVLMYFMAILFRSSSLVLLIGLSFVILMFMLNQISLNIPFIPLFQWNLFTVNFTKMFSFITGFSFISISMCIILIGISIILFKRNDMQGSEE